MKILYSWLKDYVQIDKTPDQLGEDLSLFGHEVESVEKNNEEAILDLEITPNRGDCLSVLGMAREIAALYKKTITKKEYPVKVVNLGKTIDVEVADPKICPRFTARIIDNIEIGPSPDWLVKRLTSYGFRPINNIVDITNYVMIATGQPLHAFDYNKISGGLMNIRLSKEGEEVITLDGYARKLPDGAAVITDGNKIYDLAGIMGGYKSEVDDKTKTIILQGAIFDPVMIRRTSKYLNHTTDASYRYERSVDFEGTIYGVDMASYLILESSPKAKAGPLIDEIFQAVAKRDIEYDPDRINRLLGTPLSENEIKENLARLNIQVKDRRATVPSYRLFDVKIWQDLAEEIARIYGYNNLGIKNLELKNAKKNVEFTGTEKIKDILAEEGFTEVYSYSFTDKNKLKILGVEPENQPQIAKPLSPETEYMRPTLLISLLNTIAKNPWAPDVNIFEMEAVFNKETEKWQLGLATVGKSDTLLSQTVKKLGLNAEIETIERKVLDAFKIRRPVKYVLVDIDEIILPSGDYSLRTSSNRYRPISKYSPTVRDLAFIVDTQQEADKIAEEILQTDEHVLLVELFDEFSSDKFGKNKKNLAYHVWLQDLEEELSEKTVSEVTTKIVQKISTLYQAKLRS